MKRIGILVLILCACFVSVAWGPAERLEGVPQAQHVALEPV